MSADLLTRCGAAAIYGYGLGAIPNGVLVGKLCGNKDPRQYGSGKTGATNVLRTVGPGPAALVVLLDIGKGAAAILGARYAFAHTPAGRQYIGPYHTSWQAVAEAVAGLAALVGHNYSIFIGFKGGRGVLTGAGAILVMQPVAWLAGFVCALTPIAVTRYVSLGSICGAIACPVADLVLTLRGRDSLPHLIFMALGGGFVIAAHGDNIKRLLSGTERKLGQPATEVAHQGAEGDGLKAAHPGPRRGGWATAIRASWERMPLSAMTARAHADRPEAGVR